MGGGGVELRMEAKLSKVVLAEYRTYFSKKIAYGPTQRAKICTHSINDSWMLCIVFK
jgi:hypothetical protein